MWTAGSEGWYNAFIEAPRGRKPQKWKYTKYWGAEKSGEKGKPVFASRRLEKRDEGTSVSILKACEHRRILTDLNSFKWNCFPLVQCILVFWNYAFFTARWIFLTRLYLDWFLFIMMVVKYFILRNPKVRNFVYPFRLISIILCKLP